MSVSLSWAAWTNVFTSSTGKSDEVELDKEIVDFRSLVDGRNKSRRR
jgi:hypothetical protein